MNDHVKRLKKAKAATSLLLIMATELAAHHKNTELDEDNDDEDEDSISDTFGSFTDYGRTETLMSRTLGSHDLVLKLTDDKIKETLSGNPKNWHWSQIKLWLNRKNFQQFIPIFDVQDEFNLKAGIEGEEFLAITLEKLFDDSGEYKAADKLGISHLEAETHPLIERFFRFESI